MNLPAKRKTFFSENKTSFIKAQVSTELLIIIGAILVIFIPLLLTVYFKTTEANETLASLQIEISASRLANLINSIGNLGEGSSIRTEIFIPQNVKKIDIHSLGRGGEVVFKVSKQTGDSEIVEIVKFPVNDLSIDNPSQGLRRFEISYNGEEVNVKAVN